MSLSPNFLMTNLQLDTPPNSVDAEEPTSQRDDSIDCHSCAVDLTHKFYKMGNGHSRSLDLSSKVRVTLKTLLNTPEAVVEGKIPVLESDSSSDGDQMNTDDEVAPTDASTDSYCDSAQSTDDDEEPENNNVNRVSLVPYTDALDVEIDKSRSFLQIPLILPSKSSLVPDYDNGSENDENLNSDKVLEPEDTAVVCIVENYAEIETSSVEIKFHEADTQAIEPMDCDDLCNLEDLRTKFILLEKNSESSQNSTLINTDGQDTSKRIEMMLIDKPGSDLETGMADQQPRTSMTIITIPTPKTSPSDAALCTTSESNANIQIFLPGSSYHDDNPGPSLSNDEILTSESMDESSVKSICKDCYTRDGITTLVGKRITDRLIESHQRMDTVITLKDGKLGAHRMVLAAASPFLEELLVDQDEKRTATLIIPDITRKTMTLLLCLGYTGSVVYTKDQEVDFFDALKTLLFGEYGDLSLVELPRLTVPKPQTEVQSPSETNLSNDEERDTEAGLLPSTSTTEVSLNRQLKCELCPNIFTDHFALQVHMDNSHRYRKESASFEEIQAVCFCHGCNTQWKTLERAQKCLQSHGLSRCWICLEVFVKSALRSHYMTNHCDESSIEDAYNTFIRCRWCPRRLNIKSSVYILFTHSFNHIPQHQRAKGIGKIKNSRGVELEETDDEEVLDIEMAKSVDGEIVHLRYKTLKGEEVIQQEERSMPLALAKIPIISSHNINENKKCTINLESLPKFGIHLNRLPQPIEHKIFRHVPLPSIPGVSFMEAAKIVYQKSKRRRQLDDIENSNGIDTEVNDNTEKRIYESVEKSGEEISDPSIVVQSDEVGKEKELNLEALHDQENTLASVSLLANTWGQVNFLAQNLSKPHFGGFPTNTMLVIGKVSATGFWEQIEGFKTEDTDILVLEMIPTVPSDSPIHSDIYDYMSTTDNIGVISGISAPNVKDIFLIPLTEENRNRAAQLPGNPAFAKEQTNSLIAIVLQYKITLDPSDKIDRKRGQKRPLTPVQTTQAPTLISEKTAKIRRGRKRLKVVPILKTNEDDEEAAIDGAKASAFLDPLMTTTHMALETEFVPISEAIPAAEVYTEVSSSSVYLSPIRKTVEIKETEKLNLVEPETSSSNYIDVVARKRNKKKRKKSKSRRHRSRGTGDKQTDVEFNTVLSNSIEKLSISESEDEDNGGDDEDMSNTNNRITIKKVTENEKQKEMKLYISSKTVLQRSASIEPHSSLTEDRKSDWNLKMMESERNKKTRWKQTKLNLSKVSTRSNDASGFHEKKMVSNN